VWSCVCAPKGESHNACVAFHDYLVDGLVQAGERGLDDSITLFARLKTSNVWRLRLVTDDVGGKEVVDIVNVAFVHFIIVFFYNRSYLL